MEEVKLCTSSYEREKYEAMADVYSIFIATESLEKGYIRDTIGHEEYTLACNRLIAQYKTSVGSLGAAFDAREFIRQYDIHCPAAVHRLVDVGVPATTEHISSSGTSENSNKHVAETVQYFITLLDALKLNLAAADHIHPLLTDLMQSLSQLPIVTPSYTGRGKILQWLKALNQMKASEELSSDDVRQLSFDLESSLSEFHRLLSGK